MPRSRRGRPPAAWPEGGRPAWSPCDAALPDGGRSWPDRRKGAAVSDACGVTFEGPLAPFASRFEEALAAEGYSKRWAQELTGLGADLSRWLAQRGLAAADLTGDVVDEFFAES